MCVFACVYADARVRTSVCVRRVRGLRTDVKVVREAPGFLGPRSDDEEHGPEEHRHGEQEIGPAAEHVGLVVDFASCPASRTGSQSRQ